jgi:hypothetical protein
MHEHPSRQRGGYLATLVTTLLLMGREKAVLSELEQARARKDAGGFSIGRKSFVNVASEWITLQTRQLTMQ